VNVAGSWPEADALFRTDPRWLGGDGGYSIDLGGDRILWLFGDSFVAPRAGATRKEATMVRNSVAIEHGRDPSKAVIAFALFDGAPRSFFAEDGERWHWPGSGVRLAGTGPLVVFLSIVAKSDGGLGFTSAGWRLARIDDPDRDPTTWKPVFLDPPPQSFDANAGAAVVRKDGYVVALASRFEGAHAGYLVRFREADLAAGLVAPEWWSGTWTTSGPPTAVMDDAGSEASIHYDANLRKWVHVASKGFGASTIAVRTAPALEGPWSDARDVFTPPESNGQKPFVYAGKAHPEIDAGDPSLLTITYATNSFDFADLLTPEGEKSLYWPRVARVRVEP
jgi:hypothetical protein